ncbi:MAG: efflux RND transporter periplasmic adaptor subunit [Pseudomonadota bacterium]
MANVGGVFRGLVALCCLALLVSPVSAEEERGEAPIVLVAPVQAGVTAAPPLVGEVVAETETALGFQAGGRISERLVRRGQRVEAGDLLARLDDRDLLARLDSARSALSQARAEATLAEQELARIRDLFDRNVASRQQLDQAVSRQRATVGAVQNAEARLVEAQNALDYAELRAPFAGVLTAVIADTGDVVAVGQPVLRLAADDGRLVEVAVPESRLSHLSSVATVRLAADGETVPARLDSVNGAADRASRTFAARFRLEPAERDRPWTLGQTARLAFEAARSVRRVPVGALFARDGQPQVFRVVDDRVEAVEVSVRAIETEHAVIEAELPEGAQVVAAGVNRLHDGQAVVPRRAAAVAAGAGEARP